MGMVGGVLMIVGMVLALVGAIMFLVAAFRESVIWGIGCLLFGPVSLIFLHPALAGCQEAVRH